MVTNGIGYLCNDGGLGGLLLEEKAVNPYIKDLSIYEKAVEYEKQFDITNWRFFMAFDGEIPMGVKAAKEEYEKVYDGQV